MTRKVFGGGVDTAITEAPMKAQRRLGLARFDMPQQERSEVVAIVESTRDDIVVA